MRLVTRNRLILCLVGVLIPILGFGALRTKSPDPLYLTAWIERGDLKTALMATGTVKAVGAVKVGSQLSGRVAELLADFNDKVFLGQPIAKLDPDIFAAKVREAEAAVEIAHAKRAIAQTALEKAGADLASAHGGHAGASARSDSAQAKADETKRNFDRKQVLTERGTLAQAAIDYASAEYHSAAALLRAAEAERTVKHSAVLAAEAGLKIAHAELQHAHALVKQQTAALEQAQIDLERTVIRAPIDGEVIGRDVEQGQTVAASLEAPTLFTIARDLRQMEIHAKIDEADIGRIQVGQRASFTVDSYPSRRFGAHVTQIRKTPETIQNVVAYTTVLGAENMDLVLLPGMTATVQIVVEHVEDVLRIPNSALRFQLAEQADSVPAPAGATAMDITRDATGRTIWSLDANGRPSPVRVRVGRTDSSATELVDGSLHAGQQVIVGVAPASDGISLFGFPLRGVMWAGH
jgi:HlyD family secretion protein